jgi:hypothetical protein
MHAMSIDESQQDVRLPVATGSVPIDVAPCPREPGRSARRNRPTSPCRGGSRRGGGSRRTRDQTARAVGARVRHVTAARAAEGAFEAADHCRTVGSQRLIASLTVVAHLKHGIPSDRRMCLR